MSTTEAPALIDYCLEVARRARRASQRLGLVSTDAKNRWLAASADLLETRVSRIIEANQLDLANAPGYGLEAAAIDRLRLNTSRVAEIASALRQVASLPDPVGEVIEGSRRPNGLEITKVRVPLGVVFFVYESRPNVTADAAAICIKSGNAVILRGGKEAIHSSLAIIECLQEAALDTGIPEDAVQMVDTTDREAVGHFLKLNQYIDVAIPRGGEGLIRRVSSEATMPVIKHFDGNCHVYVDEDADLEMALRIVENSKCQRLGVCNALESLVVHAGVAKTFLPRLDATLSKYPIELRGCEATRRILPKAVVATEDDWRREYLGPILSVIVVSSIEEAIEHINRYGSKHTDAIVTNNLAALRLFTAAVDSSAVMVNASTRFNDGGEFGFGAEIGISTDKFHARGPCGLRELTSYKYIVHGEGHIRRNLDQERVLDSATEDREIMDDERLTAADVDSLLKGGATAAPAAAAPGTPKPEPSKPPPKVRVMAYDFKRPERVGKELVRSLQSLHEGLAEKFWGFTIGSPSEHGLEVRLISVDQLTYREFIQSVEVPTCFNLLRPKPLERNWILDVSPTLLYPIIDRMLGGAVSGESNLSRPLSEIELRLAGRITSVFLRELKAAWSSVLSLEIDVERVESNPQLVQIVPPNEVVVMVSFEVIMGTTRGMTNLCIPFNSIERVATKLTNSSWVGYATIPSNEESRGQIASRIDASLTSLVVTLARSQISTGDLFDLQIGDIISTEKDIQHPLQVEVSDTVKFLASPGSYKGRKAIKIEQVVET